jgi:alkanesulfonate monooxygenase SsuD/methylene tetrahydromethanopterin reductase-like flavin-dependent oxidoreductase (luciferase family)
MHLGVFVLGGGNHSAGWRWEGAAVSNNDLAVIQEIARIAERGKFDLLFISDGLDYEQGDLPSFMCRFEPTSLISVLSAHTTRLGLGATVSTSFTETYNVVRLFASVDHISQGRAAWNAVTSSRPKAALNFNFDRQMSTSCVTSAPRSSSTWSRGCGTAGRTGRSSPTRPTGSISMTARSGRSTTRAGSFRSRGR